MVSEQVSRVIAIHAFKLLAEQPGISSEILFAVIEKLRARTMANFPDAVQNASIADHIEGIYDDLQKAVRRD